MRPPGDEYAPFIAELFSRESPEPMSVERIRRLLGSPRLDVAGEVTPELVAWAETRAREAGVRRMLTATWDVGGTTAQLLESSGWSATGFGMRMRIDVAGREFSPRFPEGICVRTFREGDEERVYQTHIETFQDVLEPTRLTFEEWSHSLLEPPLFHPDLWFLAEDADELAGIALCDPH